MPVLAGAGGYDTRDVIGARRARVEALGADGLLSVTPYLQQADARRALPALPRDRRTRRRCRSSSTTCRAAPASTSSRRRSRAWPRSNRGRRQGSLRQHVADARRSSARAGGLRRALGDDALTLPLMAVGGTGVISVASNDVPGEMARMVELAGAATSPARARCSAASLPLMQVNFVESNPGPVKAALGHAGLLEEVVPPADGAAAPESLARDRGRC